MADRAVHLLAAQHQLDRPADQPRRQDAENLRPGQQPFEPNPPPRKGLRIWMFSGGMPNEPGRRPCGHGQALARRVDRQPVAVPGGHDGVRLHRVVVLGRASHRSRRSAGPPRQGRPRHRRAAPRPGCRRRPPAGRSSRSPSRSTRAGSRLIARRQQRGAFGRGLQRLGDHDGDRLVRHSAPSRSAARRAGT